MKSMQTIETLVHSMEFNRVRTLGLIERVRQEPEPKKVLGWRPGVGRAHVAWQLLHIAVTEEIFATERLASKPSVYEPWLPRFRGGSTPDDNIPGLDEIIEVLAKTRGRVIETIRGWDDSRLSEIPDGLKQRNMSFHDALHVLIWHEAHHQGQAHITLNLLKAAQV